MDHETFRQTCLGMPGASADFPFDEDTEVFRVGGKIFALCAHGQTQGLRANLKCDPDLAVDLRGRFPEIVPGWHMNKRHWNTVRLDGALPDETIRWLVEHSHACVGPKKKAAGQAPRSE